MSGSTAHKVFTLYKDVAECFVTIPKKSHFTEKGVLNPEEFVKAGDLLVQKCPTWKWCKGEKGKVKSYLPEDKQYLITKNVPCLKRCKDLIEDAEDEEDLDGWVGTHTKHVKKKKEEEIEDINDLNEEDDDEILDIDDFNNDSANWEEEDDDAVVHNANVLKTRTYDLTITYDKYYQTPRVWLFGYDENGKSLTTTQVLEDIHVDYSNKTVTIENHPHENYQVAGIHPCKHAHVMKVMIDKFAEKGQFPRVDLYLFLFLKFISSVIPTIMYDFTVEVEN